MSPTEVYFKIKVSEIIIMDLMIFNVLESVNQRSSLTVSSRASVHSWTYGRARRFRPEGFGDGFAAFVGNFSNFSFIGSGGFVGLFDTRFSIWTFVSGHEPSPSIVVFSPHWRTTHLLREY